MTTKIIYSWGRTKRTRADCTRPRSLSAATAELVARSADQTLPYGSGRSYGDVCLNDGGRLLVTDHLDRFIEADWNAGIIRAEAGVTLDGLLRITVPRGWFPFVIPGTRFVTLGGLVANDVHGKNHEAEGTFGCHVRSLGLARSDGQVLQLSRDENFELFAATIGGLGLTGLITWVEIELQPIASSFMEVETTSIRNLEHFFRVAVEQSDWPYQVAWVDCLAKGRDLGRGFYIRGRHASGGGFRVHRDPRLNMPIDLPFTVLNGFSVRTFNALYRRRPWVAGKRRMPYDRFFFPLDAVNNWARLYGRRGFFQHQSAIPLARALDTTRRLLELAAEQRDGSFLAVLKLFGSRRSPGILSFPLPGATLALDFPNRGGSTTRLLQRMTELVIESGGRIYPAKDATMSANVFRAGYPDWQKVESLRDPKIMSDFWRRVTA